MITNDRKSLPLTRMRQPRRSLKALAIVLATLALLWPAGLVQAAAPAPATEPGYDDPPLELTPVTVEDLRARIAPPEQPAPLSIPTSLLGKIVFKSGLPSEYLEETFFVLDPANGDLWEFSESWPHECGETREAFSANRQYRAFLAGEWMEVARYEYEDGDASADHAMQLQLKYYDRAFGAVKTLSHFGARGLGPNPNSNGDGDEFEWAAYGHVWDAAWSPTGDLIAFVSNETTNEDIYVVTKDQWPPRQLTRNDWAWDKHPSWSPDGQQIVFESNRDGQHRLWLMNADGSNQRPLTDPILAAHAPVWIKYVGADGCP